jgi:L-malate glycosyltransferase
MKLCYLADANSIHTIKWVEYFSSMDYEVHLISMNKATYNYKENVKLYTIEPPFSSKLSYFFIINKIKKIVNTINPDILHSHYASSYGLFGRMCNFHPFIISVWGSDIYQFPKSNKVNFFLMEYILAGADKICSTSEDMAKETRKYCTEKDISITPFGVDTEIFYSQTPILNNKTITIGIVKSLEEIYGINFLIDAFARLINEKSFDIRLLIVGDGTQNENLRQQCSNLGISSKVEFTGKVENTKVPYYINQMDIACLPSLSESFGVFAVEASACGRPIVATEVGGLKEVVIDNFNGVLVKPSNVEDLVEKIKFLIQHQDKMKEYSLNGKALVDRQYSLKQSVNLMKQIYDDIIDGRRQEN